MGDPVQSLGRDDPLGKGMATHSDILVWRIPQTEEPGRLQSMDLQRVSGKLSKLLTVLRKVTIWSTEL